MKTRNGSRCEVEPQTVVRTKSSVRSNPIPFQIHVLKTEGRVIKTEYGVNKRYSNKKFGLYTDRKMTSTSTRHETTLTREVSFVSTFILWVGQYQGRRFKVEKRLLNDEKKRKKELSEVSFHCLHNENK